MGNGILARVAFEIFGNTGYTPYGYCLAWDSWLLTMTVLGNAMIAAACVAIPIQIMYIFFHARRRNASVILGTHNYSMRLFAAFVFFCGITHQFGIYEIWNPHFYWVTALFDVLTGMLSILTALLLGFVIKVDYKRPSDTPSNTVI